MNRQEAFSILNLSSSSSSEEIKKQYKKLTKEFHPDVNKDPNAEEKFKKINEAYKIITSPDEPEETIQFPWGNPFSPFGRSNTYERDEQPIHLYTNLSFKDAVFGCRQDLHFSRNGKCNNCNGQGHTLLNNGCKKCQGKGEVITRKGNMIFSRTCDQCHGKIATEACTTCSSQGFISTNASVSVSIPGGISNDNTLRLSNMGNFVGSFMHMDRFTDVYLHVSVEPHPSLTVQGSDVISHLTISLLEALQGCQKVVPTVQGEQDITIPPLSKNLEEIKMPRLGVSKIGCQKVILQIEYPQDVGKLIQILNNQEN